MGLSEFNVHNVLRTYARQERLGGVHRAKTRLSEPAGSADQVRLSPSGRKIQSVGNLAVELVNRRYLDLGPEEKSDHVRRTRKELLERYDSEIRQEAVSPEAFEAGLKARHLDWG